MEVKFSPSDAISAAVSVTKGNWYILTIFLILIYVVNQLVSGIVSGSATAQLMAIAQSRNPDPEVFLTLLGSLLPNLLMGSIIASIFASVLRAGMVQACLDVVDGAEPQFSAFTRNKVDTYLHYVLCILIVSVLTYIGTLFCVIPGIYVGVRLLLAPFYVIDKKLTCIDAIKAAWSEAGGNWWNLFLLGILIWLCNFGGAILCCVGLLYTLPVMMVAEAIAYRDITRGQAVTVNE